MNQNPTSRHSDIAVKIIVLRNKDTVSRRYSDDNYNEISATHILSLTSIKGINNPAPMTKLHIFAARMSKPPNMSPAPKSVDPM